MHIQSLELAFPAKTKSSCAKAIPPGPRKPELWQPDPSTTLCARPGGKDHLGPTRGSLVPRVQWERKVLSAVRGAADKPSPPSAGLQVAREGLFSSTGKPVISHSLVRAG